MRLGDLANASQCRSKGGNAKAAHAQRQRGTPCRASHGHVLVGWRVPDGLLDLRRSLSMKSGALAPRITHRTYAPMIENSKASKRVREICKNTQRCAGLLLTGGENRVKNHFGGCDVRGTQIPMLNGRRNGEGNCRINGVAHEDKGRK